jgi:cellulose synthase/poly-beta-1,6-N-acetylglucosamine synthase-like glycosyltransferase
MRGLDATTEWNLRAALDLDYPGALETIFVFDDDRDPAVPLVRRVIRELHEEWRHGERARPTWARILFSGATQQRDRKLHAMTTGLDAADGELVAFAESDTRPHAETLSVLVETLLTFRHAGCAFAPVHVTAQPQTLTAAGYALYVNGLLAPAIAATASQRGGSLPFVVSSMMVFKREALEAIGGLEEAPQIDHRDLGARLLEVGYRSIVAPAPLPIVKQRLDVADFAHAVRSDDLTRSFKLSLWRPVLLLWLGLALVSLAVALGPWWAAAVAALVPLALGSSL